MKSSTKIVFSNAGYQFFNTCVITGMCRVGKTLIGNVLSTAERVEYAEEPWFLQISPLVQAKTGIDKALIKGMFSAYMLELFKDTFLLRSTNFRPSDLSFIGRKKTDKEINFRLNNVHKLNDVIEHGRDHIFMINLAETFYAFRFLQETIMNLKIIYVTRHPYSVAQEISEKKWFSDDELLNPSMASPFIEYYSKGEKWYLPWWISSGYEEFFLNLSSYERGVYYWFCMTDASCDLVLNADKNIYCINYEDFTQSPEKYFFEICNFLNIEGRAMTMQKLKDVRMTPIWNGEITNTKLKRLCLDVISKLNYGYEL